MGRGHRVLPLEDPPGGLPSAVHRGGRRAPRCHPSGRGSSDVEVLLRGSQHAVPPLAHHAQGWPLPEELHPSGGEGSFPTAAGPARRAWWPSDAVWSMVPSGGWASGTRLSPCTSVICLRRHRGWCTQQKGYRLGREDADRLSRWSPSTGIRGNPHRRTGLSVVWRRPHRPAVCSPSCRDSSTLLLVLRRNGGQGYREAGISPCRSTMPAVW